MRSRSTVLTMLVFSWLLAGCTSVGDKLFPGATLTTDCTTPLPMDYSACEAKARSQCGGNATMLGSTEYPIDTDGKGSMQYRYIADYRCL